jgi:hypothetical protein
MQTETRWYHYIAYFVGGVFLANAIPHLVNGISGNPFQSPFASPPGKGLSSATVNVLWGTFNLVVAYVLVARVGRFDLRQTWHVVVLGVGAREEVPVPLLENIWPNRTQVLYGAFRARSSSFLREASWRGLVPSGKWSAAICQKNTPRKPCFMLHSVLRATDSASS